LWFAREKRTTLMPKRPQVISGGGGAVSIHAATVVTSDLAKVVTHILV
jgi:hypothetical protein